MEQKQPHFTTADLHWLKKDNEQFKVPAGHQDCLDKTAVVGFFFF